ncbi:unnamed protein product [Rotaria magnacalcarata]|uniref:Uncharacterized protein n=1 Tax=Rotaria magnacalcarata TaxID=392030 RepID=A0A820EH66_9BILA|nr:unnamed protein product [Rotaria magnacalcarata]CAF2109402.1 unnamed protein product [Rotaria magnacalcarata]CAF3969244.1 unnamed protein product [Rotaria magnacalcarata]CAF4246230.1 unnamed protein product [Rotaria magnacalcarata]
MDWLTGFGIFIVIILAIILGVIVACMLGGQHCTLSIQKRQQNHELTQIQQEQEKKQQKKLSSRLKRTLKSTSKPEQPVEPVEDVKTLELTFKLGGKTKKSEPSTPGNDASVVLLPQIRVTHAEIDERQKKYDALRKKYNI